MTVRPDPAPRHPAYPRTVRENPQIRGQVAQGATTTDRPAHEEAQAFEHEHGRLYEALERTAQLAELAGHDGMADGLRDLRRDVAREIAERTCAYREAGDGR